MPNKIRKFLFGTLRRQLIFGVAITHAILMSLLLFDLALRQEAMFLERQKEHAIALARSLALSSADWVAANDIAGQQELVDAQKRYPELMYSILTNSKGRILAHNDRQKVGLILLDFPQNTQEKIFRADNSLIDIAVPVMLAGKHVGWSRVGVGQGMANQKIAEIRHEGIIYALIAILLGSLMAWIMGRKITQRLHSIQKVMLDVKAGNSQKRILLDGNDEASVLAREFNGMLDVVAQREQDLNNSKEQLEERVHERTAEIEKSVNRLREQAELLNLTTDGIIVRTMGNVITFWNKGAEQQYGWKAEEVVGKDIIHDLLKTIFPIPLNEIIDILLHNNHWEGELTQTRSDGSKLIVASRWVIQRNDADMPVAIMEVNNDISERKKAEEEKTQRAGELVIANTELAFQSVEKDKRAAELVIANTELVFQKDKLQVSEERLNVLFMDLPDAYLVIVDGVFVECNRAAETMLRGDRKDIIGKPPELLSPEFQPDGKRSSELAEEKIKGTLSAGAMTFEWVHRRLDGSDFFVEVSSAAIMLNGKQALLIIWRDITERKRIEQELQEKNTELDRFAYTVSHDLKSPLITIQAYVGMIKKDLETGKYERAQDDMKRVEGAADKMTSLLNDLLELSRAGRKMNDPSPVDMNCLVKNALQQLTGPIAGNHVEIVLQPDLPSVLGDQKRIAEVVQNLIENAIKYRGGQSAPRIEIGTRLEGKECVFFVRDNGKGIDPRHQEKVFGLFNKLDAESEGTGVGLALVKRIIEAHGGRVWVESEGEGLGCCFCFTLQGGGGGDDDQPDGIRMVSDAYKPD